MVCRTRANEELSLGFCVPPKGDGPGSPGRLAAHGKLGDIQEIRRPPNVMEISALPVQDLEADPARRLPWAGWPTAPEGCTLRLVGSRMWEFLTGVRYTSATSDLDLVIDLVDAHLLGQAATFLSGINALSPWKIDAEISIPHRGEVHWREWLSNAETILVKSLHSVDLQPRAWISLTAGA